MKLQVIKRNQTKQSFKWLHRCFYGCLFDATCLACSLATKCMCIIYNWIWLHYTLFLYLNELTSILLDWAFLEGWLSLLLKEDDPTFGLACCWKTETENCEFQQKGRTECSCQNSLSEHPNIIWPGFALPAHSIHCM